MKSGIVAAEQTHAAPGRGKAWERIQSAAQHSVQAQKLSHSNLFGLCAAAGYMGA